MLSSLGEREERPSPIDLFCAIYVGNELAFESTIESLHENETREEWPSYLPLTIESNISAAVDIFLRERTNVNYFPMNAHRLLAGKTALQAASEQSDLDLMKALIQRRANVNVPA